MSIEELNKQVSELRELRRMADELGAEIDSITDKIKRYMEDGGKDELHGLDWKITWKEITSSRFDSAAFKKSQPDTYSAFCKSSTSRRFILA